MPEKTEWEKRRQKFIEGWMACTILFLLSFFIPQEVEAIYLHRVNNEVIDSIDYVTSKGKKTRYLINISLESDERNYQVNGLDYQTFNHADFKKEVQPGDIVNLKICGSGNDVRSIHSLIKNGKDYCSLEKRNERASKSRLWGMALFGYAWIICFLASCFEKQPKFSFVKILVIGLILIAILLLKYIGLEYIQYENYG